MTVSVSALNKYIKSLIEDDLSLINVSVKGELSNFKQHSSGHCYMTLKDENSAIAAVMFKGSADKIRFQLENGMKVIATGRVSVYERDGRYQLYIDSITPDGIGDLHLAFEQLKQKLQSEGYFDQSRKKALPKFPKTVGVVTSPTGAAVRDIVNVISRRYPLCEVLICPVLVQGENAANQIANAIGYINSNSLADVIIVGRGGGSIEDLWAFNELPVAMAIAQSEIPVISAVGHETDFSISDFVADLRAPTPSAAAELAVPSAVELSASVSKSYGSMLNAILNNINYKRSVLSRFAVKSPMDYVSQNRIRVDNCEKHLINAVTVSFNEMANKFSVSVAKLNSLNPLSVLTRGFAVASGKRGIIKSVSDINSGDVIDLRLCDGSAKCTVN
ncbi:MAG: exodeoxyribonuclease VII large subunit [Clostridia bacterium]|nr:exodeoxyribonuclease VII large subunit [Clostridia bacterium]